MGFPTKVQLIQRKDSQQWYINFPSAVAQAMEFTRGEVVEWIVEDKNRLLLRRRKVSAAALKKTKLGKVGWLVGMRCSIRRVPLSRSSAASSGRAPSGCPP